MTTLPVLGVVSNDKRDTLSFIFQVEIPALEECIRKKNIERKTFNWKRVIAVTAKPGSATLQQQGAEVLLEQLPVLLLTSITAVSLKEVKHHSWIYTDPSLLPSDRT